MEYNNSVYPNEEQIKGFLDPGAEGPIGMVNLLKFKPKAEYEDGRETDLTGRKAYELYEEGVSLKKSNPAHFVGVFNKQKDRAKELSKFGYASLQASSLLARQ